MLEDFKQRTHLARKAQIDIYISGGNGRFSWPYRLQPADEDKGATPSVRRKAIDYILDSGFDEGGVDTAQLIEKTYEHAPTYTIPNDTVSTNKNGLRDPIIETAEKVSDFLDEIDEKSFPSTVLIPLQPPYDFHLAYLHEHYPRQARRSHFALGGLLKRPPEEQINHIRRFQRIDGYQSYVHGFGLGCTRPIIEALRKEPELLDSADFSTPQHHASSGQIAGASRRPVYVGHASGDEVSTIAASSIVYELCDIARMLAPSLTSDDDLEYDAEKLGGTVDQDTSSHVEEQGKQTGIQRFTAE